MKIQNNDTKDEGLKGNEKIEEAISALQQEVSQVVECGERVVENLLFERRFAHDGFENFLSQGYAFHAISKD